MKYRIFHLRCVFFSENFSVKLQEEKERENICYYTCDVFQHVKNQLELMTWNWIIPSIPIACAKILLILCAKKVVKVQNGFSKRKLFTWCFDEFFGSITKGHYMIVKLKSKQFLETRHAKVLSFGLWTSFSRRRINKINQFLNSVFLNWTKIWLNLQKSQIHPNEPNLSIRAPSQI